MRKPGLIAAGLAAVLATAGLAGCGSSSSLGTSGETNAAAPTTSTAAGSGSTSTPAATSAAPSGNAVGAVRPYQPAHRGGTMILVWNGVGSSIDPAVDYDSNWQLLNMVGDGLVTWKKVTGPDGNTLVPDLAEAIPTPQDGGKKYTFTLRKGILFNNGTPVHASDIKYAILRQFVIPGPVPSFYSALVGADVCIKTPKSCNLDRGIVVDDPAGTITFNLSAPDADFLLKLASTFAYAVPKGTPMKDTGTKPIPTTGPYMISRYVPNQEMDFVRNPHFKEWSREAQPEGYPDKIVLKIGLTTEDETTMVANGQADWMYDQVPSDRLEEIAQKSPDQIHLTPLNQMYHMAMNVRVPPFNNLKVRQALNYATDRKAIQTIWGGPQIATITCQILPPNFPGYKPYCPYTKNPGTRWSAPDMAKAQQLVDESGTKGQTVTINETPDSATKSIGAYYVSLLEQLGYKANTKILSSAVQYPYVQDSRNKVQISFSYWQADYTAPSNFLDVAFGCAGFTEASTASPNLPEYCVPAMDARVKAAEKTQVTDVAAANEQWAAIDHDVTDAAPIVALFVQNKLDFVSKRVGNFQGLSSVVGAFMIDQAWIK